MSTSIAAAWAAVRARIEATVSLPVYWPEEDKPLPDVPAAFVFVELTMDRPQVIEIGGGRGANRHRNTGEVNAYVFVPRGTGMDNALTKAEAVAAALRGHRGSGITMETCGVHPVGQGEALAPNGMDSASGNYACAVASAPIFFDQTG